MQNKDGHDGLNGQINLLIVHLVHLVQLNPVTEEGTVHPIPFCKPQVADASCQDCIPQPDPETIGYRHLPYCHKLIRRQQQ